MRFLRRAPGLVLSDCRPRRATACQARFRTIVLDPTRATNALADRRAHETQRRVPARALMPHLPVLLSRSVSSSQRVGIFARYRIGGSRGEIRRLIDDPAARPGCVTKSPRSTPGAARPAPHPGRHALDLGPVDLFQLVPRTRDPCRNAPSSVSRQQTLAVGVEPAGRIDARYVDGSRRVSVCRPGENCKITP